MAKAELAHLATPGATLELRVTPKASRNEIREEAGTLRVYVTTAPEDGKANAAVQKLLAKALGVPKSRLTLIRGATARDKVFRVEP
ncbi:DUF167 domain-containing protein [Salipiger abyssi]|uniref:UPF0235 protein Ga0080574_TMP2085 n=1 Tax=Salipiger abyssi TaxID=1250539 RepID=A0A1P8USN0_9RHOB|nr:DUF167 domain-containing protein [Salipiger abyssi]APZ52419.1 hypothetical protein Ga0080574_TMP2085 [Salipiger abyssi]